MAAIASAVSVIDVSPIVNVIPFEKPSPQTKIDQSHTFDTEQEPDGKDMQVTQGDTGHNGGVQDNDMRAVVQRVTESRVTVDGKITGEIGKGLMVLIGVEDGDGEKDAEYIAGKVTGLRVFEDENDKLNLSVKDIGGGVLAVSQFTLLGDVRKGKRPSFTKAAAPEEANALYRKVIELIQAEDIHVEEGIFRADMMVEIHNDGPVTILLDSNKNF